MKAILILLLMIMTHTAVHAELFKWVDAEGNIIYSDQPPPDHGKKDTEIDPETLPQIITVPTPEISTSPSSSNTASNKNSASKRYQELTIVEPVHDTSVRENSGKVKITVHVSPDNFAERGDKLIIYMDDVEVSRGEQTSITLDNVDRGTHQVKAALLNSRGQVIKETNITSFTLQRFHL